MSSDQIDSNPDKQGQRLQGGGTLSGTIYNDVKAWWFSEAPVSLRGRDVVPLPMLTATSEGRSGRHHHEDPLFDFGKYTSHPSADGLVANEVVPGEAKVDGTDVNLADYKQTFAYGSSMTIAQIGGRASFSRRTRSP